MCYKFDQNKYTEQKAQQREQAEKKVEKKKVKPEAVIVLTKATNKEEMMPRPYTETAYRKETD